MNAHISADKICGTLKAISSKSAAHRLLICAAFADNKSKIKCEKINDDIIATVNCLKALGTNIEYYNNTFTVEPLRIAKSGAALDCNESGSTLRFLLPIACAVADQTSFVMSGRLPERPLSPLREELEAHGIVFEYAQKNILNVKGKLAPGNYTISGEVSSQFISGLLFALSILDKDSTLTVTGNLESAPYVQMTLDALALFGAKIKRIDNKFIIFGTKLHACDDLYVEGDWSNAAFPLCMAAIAGSVTVEDIYTNSSQGDKAILDILSRFGAEVKTFGASVTVKKNILRGIKVDATNIPDLVPVIATVASVSEGRTVIYGAKRLRIKESDRLITTRSFLNALGADVSETDDGLVIYGKKNLCGGVVSSFNDHRIAMSAAVASLVSDSSVTIKDAEAVNKSYPDFYRDMERLGLNISFEK